MKRFLLLCMLLFSASAIDAQAHASSWIYQAYFERLHRGPSPFENNMLNYNNGSWNNYEELKKYVNEFIDNMNAAGITFRTSAASFARDTKLVAFFQNDKLIAAALVATGAGNIIASGAACLAVAGAGNVKASDGTNMIIPSGTKGIGFEGTNPVKGSGAYIIKTSGSGSLVIH